MTQATFSLATMAPAMPEIALLAMVSILLVADLFFKANEKWLAKVLAEGAQAGTLAVNGKAENAARALFAAFQGSVLASRLFNTKARLEDVEASVRIGR